MIKTIHFRQIEWFGAQENLLSLLQQTLAALPLVENTIHIVGSEESEVRHRTVTPNEIRLHFVTYVQGARKGIRPLPAGTAIAPIGEAMPPANSEFVEKELAVVVRAGSLGYVAAGQVFGSHVEKTMRALLALHHPGAIANRLLLPARADAAMIAQLTESGIDRLDLAVALPGPDAQVAGVGEPVGVGESLARSLWDGLSARLFEDHGPDDIDALAHATAHIGIRLGRKPSAQQVEALTEVATDAINSGDEFRIRNLDGVEFTRDKLLLKSSYRQQGAAAILAVNQAWVETGAFLDNVS